MGSFVVKFGPFLEMKKGPTVQNPPYLGAESETEKTPSATLNRTSLATLS
jgi:hypothetical protein